jgi:peptidoglycan/LPS O-acetylase OafA/YrhL
MKSRNFEYLPGLDHLRGLAASLVVFYHGFHWLSTWRLHGKPLEFGVWARAESLPMAVLIEGHSGVSLFLMMSGFIFTWGAWGSRISWGRFLANRVLRIYPLFLLLLFTGIAAHRSRFDFAGFLQTLLGMANVRGTLDLGPFSAMFWTISIELQFYLLFPFLLRFFQERGARALWLVAAVALALRGAAVLTGSSARDFTHFTLPGRIELFLVGMWLAARMRQGAFAGRGAALAFPAATLALSGALWGFNRAGGFMADPAWKIFWPSCEALLWGAFLVSYLALAPRLPALWSRAAGAVGVVSYSIYLTHLVVLDLVMRRDWLPLPGLDAESEALARTALLVYPLVLALSALSYHAVEKPFLELRGRYLEPRAD